MIWESATTIAVRLFVFKQSVTLLGAEVKGSAPSKSFKGTKQIDGRGDPTTVLPRPFKAFKTHSLARKDRVAATARSKVRLSVDTANALSF